MKIRFLLALAFCYSYTLFSQEYFPKNDGVKSENTNYTAFTNAKIYVTPTKVIEKGILLIGKGKVIASGASVSIPPNTEVIDLEGKYIYPSFIDLYTDFGVDKPRRESDGRRSPQYDASREGFYWNDHVMPENNAVDKFRFDDKKAKELLEAGFGVVNAHIPDGIVRGSSVLVALNMQTNNNKRILEQRAAQHLSFSRSIASRQNYPTSLMGAMALLRQLYHDARWYEAGNSPTRDFSIEALLKNRNLPQIMEANDKLNDLRAYKIASEFNLNYLIKGGGNEFERIREVAATKASFIIPVDFPEPYDVADPYQASKISLADMRLWNQAPYNLKALADTGVTFALTTSGLKTTSDFKTNLLRAIAYGFDKTRALEALTIIPANLIRKSNELGSLRNGSYANFLVTSGDVFEKETILYENWVQGQKYTVNDKDTKDIRGNYQVSMAGMRYELTISGELEKLQSEIKADSVKLTSKINYADGWLNLFFTPAGKDKTQFVRLTAFVISETNLTGKAILADGNEVSWQAEKKPSDKKESNTPKKSEDPAPKLSPITYPNKAFGYAALPVPQTTLFKNATVWTGEDVGILQNTDVLVRNGKIAQVGNNLADRDAVVIDATGKYLTAGIIDEHSHIATAAVNEAGHNSSAEVTIEDVVNSEDINIYRNLSGGVTAIQILHGSANPIGGRSAIIKLKWGENPENLLLKNRPKFIKFALGENVKQSNWGATETVRFPQTRMGVEQVYMDYFQRAKTYGEQWKRYNALPAREKAKTAQPRYDMEMETLYEILAKERFITCHSYVQSEINMLMKVAEKFGFNINTFTHILEGYKVADKMAKHGAGGSTFSDWWAYKYEVYDAIPYNAAIMHSQGVTVAINSDDAEMSRRLNQEAAKTMKYGGVNQEEAWKFVTLNPAKLLHLDDRMGSIKIGKDADLVLWNENPLSVYAVAEKTMIDGAIYYDYEGMKVLEKQNEQQRNELIQQQLAAKNKGMKTQSPKKKEEEQFHCDTLIYEN